MKKLVDPELGDDYDGDQLERMAFAAALCTRAAATWRPSMDEVPYPLFPSSPSTIVPF